MEEPADLLASGETAICDTLRRSIRGDRMINPAHTQNFLHPPSDYSHCSTPAIEATAFNKTSQPAAKSAFSADSCSLCEIPPAQGTKIIDVGATLDRYTESWPAPETIFIDG